jgi:UDP-glucose 4-epimerase
METCLVTGAAGFIGSHLCERLIAAGCRVVGVDSFSDYYPRPLKEANISRLLGSENFMLAEGDLLQLDLKGLVADVSADYVFQLAAQPGVRTSWGETFGLYLQNNVLTTQRLLEAVKDKRLKKFVYASSSSVYGDAETFPTSEEVKPRPVSPYGVTKLAGEHLCLLYGRNYGLPVVALRFFTVYGPRQRPDMAFFRFIRAILTDQPLTIFGDGEQTRDFTYVDDAVEATVRAAFSPVAGEVFNVGGGSRVTIRAVVGCLEEITGTPASVRHAPFGPGDARHTSADITKATRILQYRPARPLSEGLEAEVGWLKRLLETSPGLILDNG